MLKDRTSTVANGLIAAWLFLGATAAVAQIPRAADGKPDLSGIWQAVGTAHWDLQDHAPQAPALYQIGAVGAVPGGRGVVQGDTIPYQPWAADKKQKNFANRLAEDPEIKCYMPGVPRATYLPFPFQIVQTQRDIFIAYEFANADRKINMGEPTDYPYGTWMGWSNGRWEGDTLVVDVTGLNGMSWLDRAGNFTSENAHVVERYTTDRPRSPALRRDDRGPHGVHAAVDDQHAAVPPYRRQRAARRVPLRRVHRRACCTASSRRNRPAIDKELHMNARFVLSIVAIARRRNGVRAVWTPARRNDSNVAADGAANWVAPKTPWGEPDLQGLWPSGDWRRVPLQRPEALGTRSALTPEEFDGARTAKPRPTRPRTPQNSRRRRREINNSPPSYWQDRGSAKLQASLIVDPPNGRLPARTPQVEQRVAARAAARQGRGPADSWEDRSLYERCISRGITSFLPTLYNNGNEILQSPGYVIIRHEMINETRIVPITRPSRSRISAPTWVKRADGGKATRSSWRARTS